MPSHDPSVDLFDLFLPALLAPPILPFAREAVLLGVEVAALLVEGTLVDFGEVALVPVKEITADISLRAAVGT